MSIPVSATVAATSHATASFTIRSATEQGGQSRALRSRTGAAALVVQTRGCRPMTPGVPVAPRNILIVDGDEAAWAPIATDLSSKGHVVEFAGGVREAE